MWEAIALSFALAMDATAVAAARGLTDRRPRELFILPATFGIFQSAMAALGWLGGRWGGPLIERWNGWVAFGLLSLLGGKMLLDGLRGGDDKDNDDEPDPNAGRVGVGLYLALGLATSIDAAAAGLTLPLVPVAPWLSLTLIGTITAACAALGFVLGRSIGDRLGGKLEAVGGVVLIAIGVKILVAG